MRGRRRSSAGPLGYSVTIYLFPLRVIGLTTKNVKKNAKRRSTNNGVQTAFPQLRSGRRHAPPSPTLSASVYLDRVVSRVVPGCRAVVVIHEEGPPGLRVDFDLPAKRERNVVVVGHRHYRRLRLQAVHAATAVGY